MDKNTTGNHHILNFFIDKTLFLYLATFMYLLEIISQVIVTINPSLRFIA